MSKLQKYMQLTKVDVAKRLIYGTFTAEQVDKSGEVADYATTKNAIQDWSNEIEKVSGGKSKGNIRKMHGKEVVGKAVDITYDDENRIITGCVEVNDQTIEEAEKGYLNGFSIGGSYAKKWPCPVNKGKTRFTPVIAEISVVDNPCVPDAVFDAVKDASFTVIDATGAEQLRKFTTLPDVQGELLPVWKAEDGSEHATKEAAFQKNADLRLAAAAKPITDALQKVEDATADLDKRDFTGKEREKAAASGAALPDGSFPIHTTEDLHNAVQAYGRAKDKGKARAHIKSRAKALGAEHMLPDTWGKAKTADDLKKGMCEVARLATIIQDLHWLVNCVHYEEATEGDEKSILPGELKDHVKTLTGVLEAMVQEEAAEMIEDHEELEAAAGLNEHQVDAIRKATKNEELFKGHALGPVAPQTTPSPVSHEALQKLTAERDALAKIVADTPALIEEKFGALVKRIKVLESLPMPDQAVITTVVKGEDEAKPETTAKVSMHGSSPADFTRMFKR